MHLWLSRCAASSAASCRGNSCRVSGAGMIVAMFVGLRLSTLSSWGLLRVLFIEMYCVLAWFGLLARGFLVASDGSIVSGPGSACLGLLANGVLCLHAQDPVAQCFFSSLCVAFLVKKVSNFGPPPAFGPPLRSSIHAAELSPRFQCPTVPCLVASETRLGAHVTVSFRGLGPPLWAAADPGQVASTVLECCLLRENGSTSPRCGLSTPFESFLLWCGLPR